MLHHSLRGALKTFNYVISSNVANVNLYDTLISVGWQSHMRPIVTINSGIYVYSTNTATPAMTVSGSFYAGIIIINNGYIVGMGGAGGNGVSATGSAGGNGLTVSTPLVIFTNNGIIAGGGGGGGGGKTSSYSSLTVGGGGGGGGQSGLTNSVGGSAGSSSPGSGTIYNYATNGQSGTISSGGTGGSGAYGKISTTTINGGDGGSGGSWGNSGGAGVPEGSGGAGGSSVVGNSYITWIATGTRYGTVS